MNLGRLPWILLLVFTTLLFGCGFHANTTVLATPNPFLDQRRFAVLPVAYEPLTPVLLADSPAGQEKLVALDERTREQWQKHESVFAVGYLEGISAATPDASLPAIEIGPGAPFQVRPVLRYLAGDKEGIEMAMTIRITAPDGRVLDEIGMDVYASYGTFELFPEKAFKRAATSAGQRTARYLQHRSAGDTRMIRRTSLEDAIELRTWVPFTSFARRP